MFGLLKKGFDYAFQVNRVVRDDVSPRAGFLQFQTYPANSVQGGGVLVTPGLVPGNYWRVEQPPQIVKNLTPVVASLQGAGMDFSGLYFQPLVDTSTATG